MAKRIKKPQLKRYRLEYADKGDDVTDPEYDTFTAANDDEASAAAQDMTNRAQVPMELFERIEGMNFYIAYLKPIYED